MQDEADPSALEQPSEPTEEPNRLAEPVDLEQPPRLPFAVVGIGASAGGLEALTEMFSALPPNSGMAFVVIQHLAPDRESMIAEILQRHNTMPVQQVEAEMGVEPNHVYVIRPGHTLTIQEGRLHLGERLEKPRHSRPIDDFFKSLADEQRERAICVILSGMGSDGAAGAQAVKAVGGLCVAQDPESAQFPSMPRHLIDAGYADLILQPDEIPEALVAYASHPYASGARGSEGESGENGVAAGPSMRQREQQQTREILAIIRTRTRFDFNGYKKPTVLRRIQRRMGLNRITELSKYTKLLRQSPAEVAGLADDLLIHVTGFFRDAEAWEALRERVVIPLVKSREADGTVRCWVAACSTGEEAYSLAMMLVEESERAGKSVKIKIFATDTAERTLSNARNGVYPGGIEADMPPERLQRFFDKEDSVYRVRQDLRERVVFAPQNMLSDPPFSRLDIVTCRNLLIYLEPEVQQRVFGLVHFGLREGGALFLGSSETVLATSGMFEAIDKKARIFRRVGPTHHGAIEFPLPRGLPRTAAEAARATSAARGAAPSVAQLTASALLALHVPAAVTVDRNLRILYYQGDTKPYLSQPSGEPTQDLMALVSEDMRGAVRTALHRSMTSERVERVLDGWTTDVEGRRHRVLVSVSPLVPGEMPEMFVLSFQQREEPEPDSAGAPAQAGSVEERASSEELQRLRDELQSAIEELQASSEEHRAAGEEAMSMNEELQSSNEELETSKEEMQSLNEELSTVNAQLHAKMDELQKTAGDLRNLLQSTDIAVIFLDSKLRIRRYTPAARKLLELIGSDVGRPLGDLAKKFTDPDLLSDAQLVLDHLVPAEREVRANDGRWYTRRVLVYRTTDDRIEGVVITFVDISDRKRSEDLAVRASAVVAGDLKAMDSLRAASNLVFGAEDMHAVLDELLGAALELHGTERGAVLLYDPGSQTLRLSTQRNLPVEFVEAWSPTPLSDPTAPLSRALREQKAVVVESIERKLADGPLRDLWLAFDANAIVCIPLASRAGELFGVICAFFSESHRPDERALRVTELLARQAADAIERMHVDEARERVLRSEQLARSALDEAARMKDEFLAALSHELRTPLSAVLLWGRMLRRALSRPVGPAIDELNRGVDAIIKSAEAQGRLIDDLLEASRYGSGKVRLELGETDLVQVMHSAIELVEPEAEAKGLRIESRLSPDVGLVVADAMRMGQVVSNLLGNALKFTPEHGAITVSLSRTASDVEIRVSDTGVGIPAEFLPSIFDRFRQWDASTTRKYGGLGLGLSITKQLVEMHDGSIRAESAGLGQGATFTVSLPLREVRREGHPRADNASSSGANAELLHGRRILLVEDDPSTREALILTLRDAGLNVTAAATGSEAIRQYRAFQPQMLLSDIGLPDFDGYAVLAQIRTIEREQKLPAVPAVAITAYAREQDRRKATEAGFDAHLAKPVDADRLVTMLAALAQP